MAKKIIFVDDSKTVLMSAEIAIQSLVDSGDVELLTYSNPLDLLSYVDSGFTYDLVITDINMPEMNGLDMAKKLKLNPAVKAKPILALTTESGAEKKSAAKEIGLSGWITKPFTNEKLLAAVKRVLRLR
jgi:two-component system chemotaxis response regulator CheY